MIDESTPRRFRFSLLNLLLLTAILVLSLTVGRLWNELRPLREDVKRLRAEVGELDIEDPKLVHAITARTYQQRVWRWKIWCPAGKSVVVRMASHDIPADPTAFPKPDGRLHLNRNNPDAAEVEVTLSSEQLTDGAVRWNLHAGGITTHPRVPEDATQWLLEGSSGWSGGPRHETLVQRPGEPLELLRIRAFYNTNQVPPPSPPKEGDGVLVWVEVEG